METWEIILIVVGVIFVLWNLIAELPIFMGVGFFVPKTDAEKFINLKDSEYETNAWNKRLLYLDNHREFIAEVPIPSIYSKYYISGVGVVPRWSKLHPKIEEYYRKARNKQQ